MSHPQDDWRPSAKTAIPLLQLPAEALRLIYRFLLHGVFRLRLVARKHNLRVELPIVAVQHGRQPDRTETRLRSHQCATGRCETTSLGGPILPQVLLQAGESIQIFLYLLEPLSSP